MSSFIELEADLRDCADLFPQEIQDGLKYISSMQQGSDGGEYGIMKLLHVVDYACNKIPHILYPLIIKHNIADFDRLMWTHAEARTLIQCFKKPEGATKKCILIGRIDLLQYAIDSGYTFDGHSSIKNAIKYAQIPTLKWLVHDKEVPLSITPTRYQKDIRCIAGETHLPKFKQVTCLLNAIEHGHLDMAKWLVEQQNIEISHPETCLMIAIRYDRHNIAKWLLDERRVRVIRCSNHVLTAIRRSRIQMLKWLVDQQGMPIEFNDLPFEDLCLNCAIQYGQLAIAKWILDEKRVPIESPTKCIITAITHRQLTMLKWLVDDKGFVCDKTHLSHAIYSSTSDCVDIVHWMVVTKKIPLNDNDVLRNVDTRKNKTRAWITSYLAYKQRIRLVVAVMLLSMTAFIRELMFEYAPPYSRRYYILQIDVLVLMKIIIDVWRTK